MSLLGLDIGTTGCKAIVFSVDGAPLGAGYRDFALHRFGGAAATGWSMAGRTMAFDPRTAEWSQEMLSRAGVPQEKCAPAQPSGKRVGTIYPEVAAELGLPEDAALVTGGH